VITGKDIIFISSIEWDFLWQGHQEIAHRLAKAGNRILYIENTGVRSPRITDTGRVISRIKHWLSAKRVGGVREVLPNIYVCSPLVLPPFGSSIRRSINKYLLLPSVTRTARKLELKADIVWTYLPTDTSLDLLNHFRSSDSTVVYYCVDNFAHLTPHVKELRKSERNVLQNSNLVFTTCPELAESCIEWNSNVHIFPFGVNLDVFPLDLELTDNTTNPVPHLNRPIVGYIGGVHRHVDFGLLIELARARPNWSWVFVGKLQTNVGELAELNNVHLLGQKPHDQLSAYVRQFDVCIVPYVNSNYTATVVPTKINEYLAVGKPVVSTNIPAVCEFNKEYNVIKVASTRPAEFLAAIEAALQEPDDPATIRYRRKIAELASWDSRLESMSNLIEAQLNSRVI
jgi:glycosyltransferase involved in cell wall biosynthesis